MSWSTRLYRIIGVIRNHKTWEPKHLSITFPKGNVGYYDTSERDDYFTLKLDGVEVTHMYTGLRYKIPHNQVETFNLDKWLTKLEGIVICD